MAGGVGWDPESSARSLALVPASPWPRAWVQGGGADRALRLELRNTASPEGASGPSCGQRLRL